MLLDGSVIGRSLGLAAAVLALGIAAAPVKAVGLSEPLAETWPEVDATLPQGQSVSIESADPFTLQTAAAGEAPVRTIAADLFIPEQASPEAPVPAVVLLHGAGGIQQVREIAYARQLAAQGVAAVVIDVFGNRRDIATGFTDRVLNITEAMYLADAYAALGYLDARPDVDGNRVALIGFSYGGMATLYAAYEQTAETYRPEGPWFAGHVAYYAPCLASFDRNTTTGAPVLMMWGSGDAIVDPDRCDMTIAELRDGGSAVDTIVFEGAYHQWDGHFTTPRTIGRDLSPCSFRVEADGTVRDARLGTPMTTPFSRRAILALCVGAEPYMIGADPAVREMSTAALSRFLNDIF